MKHWIPAALIVFVVAIGVSGLFFIGGHSGPGMHDVVTRTIAADGSETIIIHEGGRHGFPFGIFIFPLGIFFLLFLARGFAFRGRWSGSGPLMRGEPCAGNAPGWFDDWHRKAHIDSGSPPQTPTPPAAQATSTEPVE